MTTSELMKAMADAGAPFDAILIAVRAIEERDAAIEATRAAARERKRRQRANTRDMDGTVTGQSRDMDGTVTATPALSRPPTENNSNPPTQTHPETSPCASALARKAPAGGEFPKPDWADGSVWADFLKNRRAKRLPNTATAYRGFLADIAKLATGEWPPGRLLEHAVMKGWGAIYAPDELKGTANGKDIRTGGGTAAKPALVDIGRQVAAELEARGTGTFGRH